MTNTDKFVDCIAESNSLRNAIRELLDADSSDFYTVRNDFQEVDEFFKNMPREYFGLGRSGIMGDYKISPTVRRNNIANAILSIFVQSVNIESFCKCSISPSERKLAKLLASLSRARASQNDHEIDSAFYASYIPIISESEAQIEALGKVILQESKSDPIPILISRINPFVLPFSIPAAVAGLPVPEVVPEVAEVPEVPEVVEVPEVPEVVPEVPKKK